MPKIQNYKQWLEQQGTNAKAIDRFIRGCQAKHLFQGISHLLFRTLAHGRMPTVALFNHQCIDEKLDFDAIDDEESCLFIVITPSPSPTPTNDFICTLTIASKGFFIKQQHQYKSMLYNNGFDHDTPTRQPNDCDFVFKIEIEPEKNLIFIAGRGIEPSLQRQGIMKRCSYNLFQNIQQTLGRHVQLHGSPIHVGTARLYATSDEHLRRIMKRISANQDAEDSDCHVNISDVVKYLGQSFATPIQKPQKSKRGVSRTAAASSTSTESSTSAISATSAGTLFAPPAKQPRRKSKADEPGSVVAVTAHPAVVVTAVAAVPVPY